jgi:hypothetical protein
MVNNTKQQPKYTISISFSAQLTPSSVRLKNTTPYDTIENIPATKSALW